MRAWEHVLLQEGLISTKPFKYEGAVAEWSGNETRSDTRRACTKIANPLISALHLHNSFMEANKPQLKLWKNRGVDVCVDQISMNVRTT